MWSEIYQQAEKGVTVMWTDQKHVGYEAFFVRLPSTGN